MKWTSIKHNNMQYAGLTYFAFFAPTPTAFVVVLSMFPCLFATSTIYRFLVKCAYVAAFALPGLLQWIWVEGTNWNILFFKSKATITGSRKLLTCLTTRMCTGLFLSFSIQCEDRELLGGGSGFWFIEI